MNLELPTVSRESSEDPLVANPGAWSGEPTFAYQWEDCGTTAECEPIEGAVEPVFQPGPLCFVRVVVTATNEGGPATAASAVFNLGCVD